MSIGVKIVHTDDHFAGKDVVFLRGAYYCVLKLHSSMQLYAL